MTISKQEFAHYIKQFQFRELFNYMGWNNDKTSQPIIVDNFTYILQAVAEKSGFKILLCYCVEQGFIPNYALRKKIEVKVTKLFHEHLIIYCDSKKQEQVWQLVIRQNGQPLKVTETRYNINQDPELLYQRASGLFFELDEEDRITIVDVTKRVTSNFYKNNERITKQFYDKFKRQHTLFLNFIKGIENKLDKEWYASLMLNRLMFCYFIQKKGFLDNNKDYLRDKLSECQLKKGKNKFYSFYRNFLLVLFHQGLGNPSHNTKLKEEIGKIPYLNGGLFDEHELEKKYDKIQVDDKAFAGIFDFFDQYEWHLDTRIKATGRDINPDVIGFIFEKYINDRSMMGAYYTKEDITEYISENCIIPHIFEKVKQQYSQAFDSGGELWLLVKQSEDRYIYDDIKHGINPDALWEDLPKEIKIGLNQNQPDLIEKRKYWNSLAPAEIALSAETWRELIERRKKYEEIKCKIVEGKITSIKDFVTNNLNIRQFIQDILENSNDSELIKHFYEALTHLTILDPTCGSGAFLFAAMNILEPLYESCIMRMHIFIEEKKYNTAQSTLPNNISYFKNVVEHMQSSRHVNTKYYIYKSIILNNLYGVDIMKEAVEIAKLRLFLKLVACVDVDFRKSNLGLEPLPDLDFNIRAGNSLIGYATEDDLHGAFSDAFDFGKGYEKIKATCKTVADEFIKYKEIQLSEDIDHLGYKNIKNRLKEHLTLLNQELNLLLHKNYNKIKFEKWLGEYQPFHWFAEFYEIIHYKKGFDVIIGNPPYLEFRQINYSLDEYKLHETNAVHAICIERTSQIMRAFSTIGMIVPMALVSTQRMKGVQDIIEDGHLTVYSNFSWRPAKLFDTVNRALTIFISISNSERQVYSNTYFKWIADTRENLLNRLSYTEVQAKRKEFWVPKIYSEIEKSIMSKIKNSKTTLGYFISKSSDNRVYYRVGGGLYWKVFTDFPPAFTVNGVKGHSTRETWISLINKKHIYNSIALLSSSTFWWWYTISSNCRDLNPYDIYNFPVNENLINNEELHDMGKQYVRDIKKNSKMLTRIQQQTGETQTQSFKLSLSKPIIDKIDQIMAKHYEFTNEELDFIINYDIKYRIGKETENDED